MKSLANFVKVGAFVVGTAVLVTGVSVLCLSYSTVEKEKSLCATALDEKVNQIVQNKCYSCHGANYEIPSLLNTLSGGLLEADRTAGLRAFKLGSMASGVALLKLESSLNKRNMPPVAYTMMHWGSRLNASDEVALKAWTGVRLAAGAQFMPIPDKIAVDPNKVELGRLLYFDKRLSDDNTVACATCHVLSKGGTDNLAFSEGVRKQFGGINAPTVFNAAFNFIQFWDGRADDLKAQAGGPPLNPVEMGYAHPDDWKKIIAKLHDDQTIQLAFQRAYPTQSWSADAITEAIAEYEKTLITPNSRFDKFLKGDLASLNSQEKEGLAYFKELGCATCHSGVNLGGNSFEYIHTKQNFYQGRSESKDDQGRMNASNKEEDRHFFKVPTLRNVALTHPYLHDGSAKTLDEAVVKMLQTQSGIAKPDVNMVKSLVAFLKAQTGEWKGIPLTEIPEDAK